MATFECSYDRSAVCRFVNNKINDSSSLYQLLYYYYYYYFLLRLSRNHRVLVFTMPLINSLKLLTAQKATAIYSLRHIRSPGIAELTA